MKKIKIGLLKIGSRISWGTKNNSAANGECKIIAEMLSRADAEVHIITKILKGDEQPKQFKFHNIETEWETIKNLNLDCLLVVNGNVNFFGGAEDRPALLNYIIINQFKGQIVYLFTDGDLYLKQVSIKGKEWSSNWNEKDLQITRTDIKYLSQAYNIDSVKMLIKKSGISIENITYFPIEMYGCLKKIVPFNPNPEFDLIYGGSHRGKKRIKKLSNYYFGHQNAKVHLFGSISINHFDSVKGLPNEHPSFGPSIEFDKFTQNLNRSRSHLIIGDPWYEGNIITLRVYESIMSSVVTFIDSSFDPERRIYKNDPKLVEWLYINSKEELIEKLELLRDDNLRQKIINRQFKAINFNQIEFETKFLNTIKSLI